MVFNKEHMCISLNPLTCALNWGTR